MNRLSIVVALLAACGKSADECRTEAEALSKLLRDTPHELALFLPKQGVTLPRRADLTGIPDGVPLVVIGNATGVWFEGELVRDLPDKLVLATTRSNAKTIPTQVFFQLDRLTPWKSVVQLVDAATRAGIKQVGFAFSTGATLTPPPRAPIDDKIDEIVSSGGDPSTRAFEFAKLASDVVGDCPALTREFHSVTPSSESKADTIIRGLAPALIECNCKVDMPALRSVMWRLMAVEPDVKVLAFDATTGTKLALPGATTWDAASKQLSPGTNYQLAVQ